MEKIIWHQIWDWVSNLAKYIVLLQIFYKILVLAKIRLKRVWKW